MPPGADGTTRLVVLSAVFVQVKRSRFAAALVSGKSFTSALEKLRIGVCAGRLKNHAGKQYLGDGSCFEGPDWQNVIDRHLVTCQRFHGKDDEQPLTGLLDEVARRMTLQDGPLNT